MADQSNDRRAPQTLGYLGVYEAERVTEEVMNALAARIRGFLSNYAAANPLLSNGNRAVQVLLIGGYVRATCRLYYPTGVQYQEDV